jgi:hypothetical protein
MDFLPESIGSHSVAHNSTHTEYHDIVACLFEKHKCFYEKDKKAVFQLFCTSIPLFYLRFARILQVLCGFSYGFFFYLLKIFSAIRKKKARRSYAARRDDFES